MVNISQFKENTSNSVGPQALDLSKGHLPEITQIPVVRGLEAEPKNWFRPNHGYNPHKNTHFVLKVQPFEIGGYEVVLSQIDLKELALRSDLPRKTGKREKREQNENDIISSQKRSKKKARHMIKSMGCDRLMTLNVRESDPDYYMTVEQWKWAWDDFNRLAKKAGYSFQYVGVMELHKKGNIHFHVAVAGYFPIRVFTKIWHSVLWKIKGRGDSNPGNVDIKFKKHLTRYKQLEGVAKYVSKYITKDCAIVDFNKKRYWASKHKLPEPRRYILNSDTLSEAMYEVCAYLGLSFLKVSKESYVFPDLMGCWFNYDEMLASEVPF